MSEYGEMFNEFQKFFADLESEVLLRLPKNELQNKIKALIKSDFQDRNFLNMIAARLKASGEKAEKIKEITDLIKERVENFHPNVKYLEVLKEYLD